MLPVTSLKHRVFLRVPQVPLPRPGYTTPLSCLAGSPSSRVTHLFFNPTSGLLLAPPLEFSASIMSPALQSRVSLNNSAWSLPFLGVSLKLDLSSLPTPVLGNAKPAQASRGLLVGADRDNLRGGEVNWHAQQRWGSDSQIFSFQI